MTTAQAERTSPEIAVTLPESWIKAGVTAEPGTGVLLIPLTLIKPSPFQTRSQENTETEIEQLRDSLLATGQAVPIAVRPVYTYNKEGDEKVRNFQLLHGHRRVIGLKHAQTDIKPDTPLTRGVARATVEECSDERAALTVLAENMARRDLTRVEIARAAKQLADTGMKQVDIAAALNFKSQGAVSNILRVLDRLPEKVLAHIERGDMSFEAAMPLLAFWQKDHDEEYSPEAEMLWCVQQAMPYNVDTQRRSADPIDRAGIEDAIGYRVRPNSGGTAANLADWKPRDKKAWAVYGETRTTDRRRLPTEDEFTAESPNSTCDFGSELGKWTWDTKAWNRLINKQLREAKAAGVQPGEKKTAAESEESGSNSYYGMSPEEQAKREAERQEREKEAEGRRKLAYLLEDEAAKTWPVFSSHHTATVFLVATMAIRTGYRRDPDRYNLEPCVWLVVEELRPAGAEEDWVPDWLHKQQWDNPTVDTDVMVDALRRESPEVVSRILWRIVHHALRPREFLNEHYDKDEFDAHCEILKILAPDFEVPADEPEQKSGADSETDEPEHAGEPDTPAEEPVPANEQASEPEEQDEPDAPAESENTLGPEILEFVIPKKAPKGLGGKKTMALATLTNAPKSGAWPAGRLASEDDGEQTWYWSGSYDALEQAGKEKAAAALKLFEKGNDEVSAEPLVFTIPKKAPRGAGEDKRLALQFLEKETVSNSALPALASTDDQDGTKVITWPGTYGLVREIGKQGLVAVLQQFQTGGPVEQAEIEVPETEKTADGWTLYGANVRGLVTAGRVEKEQVAGIHAEGCKGYEQPLSNSVRYSLDSTATPNVLTCAEEACTGTAEVAQAEASDE